MTKIIRTILFFLGVVFISLFVFRTQDVNASEQTIELSPKSRFDAYAEQNLENAIKLFVEDLQIDNASERKTTDDVILLKPHIIYHVEKEQDAIYYYPAYDKDSGQIIFVMPVIQIENDLYYEVKGCRDSAYNIICQNYDEYIFYLIGNRVYAENTQHIIDFNSGKEIFFNDFELSEDESTFVYRSYEEKKRLVQSKTEEMTPVMRNNKPQVLDSRRYKASISLYQPQGQYGYDMCWASAVATVVNQLNHPSTPVLGFDVCNHVGVGYNEGGTVYDEQDGLWYYNLDYAIHATCLGWSDIVSNISNGKPFIINVYSSHYYLAHAVVGHGYSGSGSNKSVLVWDSNLSSGSGDYTTFLYSAGGFSVSGVFCYWESTLSYNVEDE